MDWSSCRGRCGRHWVRFRCRFTCETECNKDNYTKQYWDCNTNSHSDNDADIYTNINTNSYSDNNKDGNHNGNCATNYYFVLATTFGFGSIDRKLDYFTASGTSRK